MKILILSFTLLAIFSASLPVFAQDLRLKDVEFEGNQILEDKELLKQINTRPKKKLEKIFFWKKHPDFIPSVLEEDLNRLKSYYNRNGFLVPVISTALDSSRSRRLIIVKILIDENEFVKVGSTKINLKGDSVYGFITSIKPALQLKQDQRFIDENILGTVEMLKRSFSDNGYPFTIVDHDITLRENNLFADVVFNVVTGSKSFFGDITISGDSLVPERFIRKFVLFSDGELYSQLLIDSTQQYMFDTDLFRYVVIASKKDSVENNKIPVEILLKELPRWSLEAGIGYGTEDKLRLAAQVTRLHFLGGTRRLILNAKTSYFLPFSIDLRFVQPNFFNPKLDLVVNPFYLRERETSYTIDRAGSGLNFIYKVGRRIDANISYSFERDNILELNDLQLDTSELKHNKSVFSIGSQFNSADDLFYPSKGFRMNGNLSYAGLGSNLGVHYYRIELSFVKYFPIADDVTFAAKISSGVIQTTRRSQRTPVEERFFLGGATSLRGWGRHKISPLSSTGFPVGGNTMIEGSGELRFPIYDILHGALFIDAGNVWADSYEYGFNRMHFNCGPGLRVKTPIGPVRLDFASPVINDSFDFQFFISVGHAF